MTQNEAYALINDIKSDYVAMVRELNTVKRLKHPDPWKLPLVERMERALRDLALACGKKPKTRN